MHCTRQRLSRRMCECLVFAGSLRCHDANCHGPHRKRSRFIATAMKRGVAFQPPSKFPAMEYPDGAISPCVHSPRVLVRADDNFCPRCRLARAAQNAYVYREHSSLLVQVQSTGLRRPSTPGLGPRLQRVGYGQLSAGARLRARQIHWDAPSLDIAEPVPADCQRRFKFVRAHVVRSILHPTGGGFRSFAF